MAVLLTVVALALAAFLAAVGGGDCESLIELALVLAFALGMVLRRAVDLHAVCLLKKDVHDVLHLPLLAIKLRL